MSHGKAVWRRLRFFFYRAPAILSTGPLLRLRVNAVSCVFFCFSVTPQFHSPVIFSGIRFPVSSHQVGPSGEIVSSTHFLFCLCISPTSIRVTPRCLPHRVIFGVIRRFDCIRFLVVRFSSDGVSILMFFCRRLYLYPLGRHKNPGRPKRLTRDIMMCFKRPVIFVTKWFRFSRPCSRYIWSCDWRSHCARKAGRGDGEICKKSSWQILQIARFSEQFLCCFFLAQFHLPLETICKVVASPADHLFACPTPCPLDLLRCPCFSVDPWCICLFFFVCRRYRLIAPFVVSRCPERRVLRTIFQ